MALKIKFDKPPVKVTGNGALRVEPDDIIHSRAGQRIISETESPEAVAERLLQQLVEVHQRWCRYCQANNTICRKSEGTSYECTVLATERAVAAEIANLQAEVEKRNTGWLEQAAKDALIIVGLECELAKREQEIIEARTALSEAHKVFGAESRDLSALVAKLQAENERLKADLSFARGMASTCASEVTRLRAELAIAERDADEDRQLCERLSKLLRASDDTTGN